MYWLISTNPKKFDCARAFFDYGFIDWKQNCNYFIGDTVYIFTVSPKSMIQYKTKVEKTNLTFDQIQDNEEYWYDKENYHSAQSGRYVRLRLIEQIDSYKMHISQLQEYGLTRGPENSKRLEGPLLKYISQNFSDKNQNNIFPDQLDNEESIYEGLKTTVCVNKYERNSLARSRCIEENGVSCSICGMNFEQTYGELGKGFIHVHHVIPVSQIGKEYKVDFKKDLIPVCPNCHAMLHRKNKDGENVSVEELREIVRKFSK